MLKPRGAGRRPAAGLADVLLVACAALDVRLQLDHADPLELALSALACGALTVRRRIPQAVFLLSLPAALFSSVVVVPLAALYTLAERSRNRPLLVACATASAVASALPWPLSDYASDDRIWTFIDFVYLLATAAAPVFLGQLVQARRDVSARLAEVEEVREHERRLHAQGVLARERAQLAREMHDVVSHQVSLIAVRAGALQVGAKDAATREAARTIRRLSVTTLDELRHMVTLLRASGGRSTEPTPQPTLAELRQLVDTSGIDVTLAGELPPGIGAPAQRAVYRTVQEALTNVRKHAPGASATVALWHEGAELGVTVVNTPPTRPVLRLPSARHGLVGLAERAENLAGAFESGPTPDGGYRARLSLPATGD
ncbi:sensor histidine kinase [Streptomyces fructofermentans]|uniref:histidine kinase n=1 Tax=Streptomyces fructofermentans TaxID=152141 RepID=A0A918NQC5_9ACTN|nr:sensor histidine kinase [Streptomyces fructofermentans]GGX87089.1 two-component sensor histidine kinase [Streptomyces fructofermentans]